MSKQENATIYYCDKCRKPIITTPNIIKTVDYFEVSDGVPAQQTDLTDVPFKSSIINTFHTVDLEIEQYGYNPIDASSNYGIKSIPRIKHLCDEHAQEITQEYIEIVQKLQDLFDFKKIK